KETRSMNRHLIAPDGRVIRELAVSAPSRYKALYGESMTDNYLQQTDLTDDHEDLYPNTYLYMVPTAEQDEQCESENTDRRETEENIKNRMSVIKMKTNPISHITMKNLIRMRNEIYIKMILSVC